MSAWLCIPAPVGSIIIPVNSPFKLRGASQSGHKHFIPLLDYFIQPRVESSMNKAQDHLDSNMTEIERRRIHGLEFKFIYHQFFRENVRLFSFFAFIILLDMQGRKQYIHRSISCPMDCWPRCLRSCSCRQTDSASIQNICWCLPYTTSCCWHFSQWRIVWIAS